MSALVRYRPADLLRWLELGAESLRTAGDMKDSPESDIRRAVLHAAGKVFHFGKSAVAEVSRKALAQLEYRLYDDHFEAATATSVKSISYADVKGIEAGKRGAFKVVSSGGNVTIKPYAWLLAAGVKMPVGWERNGMEVPFELLIEELAARTKAPVKVR